MKIRDLYEKRQLDTRDEQLARAEQLGFDTSQVWYHGTTAKNFKQFKSGKNGFDELGPGIYLSRKTGETYFWSRGEGGRTIPCFIRKGPIWDWDKWEQAVENKNNRGNDTQYKTLMLPIIQSWQAMMIDKWGPEGGKTNLQDGWDQMDRSFRKNSNYYLKKAGFIGALKRSSQLPSQIVVFDPNDIRSVFAKFKKPVGGLSESRSVKWNGKYVVWGPNGHGIRIAVDTLNAATHVTAWSPDNQRIGFLTTRSIRRRTTDTGVSQYLTIGKAELDRKYRGQGIGQQMYRALLRNLAPQFSGIASYLPDVINKRQVPKIHRKLNAESDDDDFKYISRIDEDRS